MGKLRNVVDTFKQEALKVKSKVLKIDQKIKRYLDLEDNSAARDGFVLVSDLAVAQGAPYDFVDNQGNHYQKTSNLAQNYEYIKINGEETEVPAWYKKHMGFVAMGSSNIYQHGFTVKGGALMYGKKYVAFPQKRVDAALNQHLTSLYLNGTKPADRESLVAYENYAVKAYGNDLDQGIMNRTFLYTNEAGQKRALDLRIAENKSGDVYQWFYYDLVKAKENGNNFRGNDVLTAGRSYGVLELLNDFVGSTQLNVQANGYVQDAQTQDLGMAK